MAGAWWPERGGRSAAPTPGISQRRTYGPRSEANNVGWSGPARVRYDKPNACRRSQESAVVGHESLNQLAVGLDQLRGSDMNGIEAAQRRLLDLAVDRMVTSISSLYSRASAPGTPTRALGAYRRKALGTSTSTRADEMSGLVARTGTQLAHDSQLELPKAGTAGALPLPASGGGDFLSEVGHDLSVGGILSGSAQSSQYSGSSSMSTSST